jgi:hypothetical protein
VTPGAAGLKGPEKGSPGYPRLGLNPEAASPKGADAARGAILPRVFPDDPARPYFGLPQRIKAAARAYCDPPQGHFPSTLGPAVHAICQRCAAYRHRVAALACTDSGWPENLRTAWPWRP